MQVSAKRSPAHRRVVALAYFHRFGWIALIAIAMAATKRPLPSMGAGCLAMAAHTLLGRLLRWKHVFCSYQSMYHKAMTPESIRWDTVKKRDVYGVSAVLAILGLALMALAVWPRR